MSGTRSWGTEVIDMYEREKEETTKVMVEMLHTNGAVRSAAWDLACKSPNLVVQH